MSEAVVAEATRVEDVEPVEQGGTRTEVDYRRSFLRWGGGTYLGVTAALLVLALREAGGRLIYVMDDPAIHLSLAENLVHHGTWGVVPGQFQSASSSPLWTVLLSGWVALAGLARRIGLPIGDSAGPLVINVLAGLWVIALVASQQRVLLPSRRRPLDALAVMALVVGVLFLPALTLLGMEHVLQIALVLSAVVLFHRRSEGRPLGWPRWLPYLLLALATLVRFETLFVVGALAVAMVAQCVPGWRTTDDAHLSGQLRRALLVCLAGGLPFLAFSVFNRAMGQGWLPNSVLAKGQGVNGDSGNVFQATAILNRLTSDPLVAAMAGVALGALLISWRQRRHFSFLAIVFLVATAGQVLFAQIGWYDRYQAYLVALGVLLMLAIADETVPSERRAPRRAFLVPGLVLVSLLLCGTKLSLTVEVPHAVADTYGQRYQAARFLARYYDDQPIATGELGYTTLEHEGPITDFFGLGDYEVLQARRRLHQHPDKAFWQQLEDERGFRVAAVYPSTLLFDTPDDWILVGEWNLNRGTVTALEPIFQFWATDPSEVAPLQAHLREFEHELPAGSTLSLNPLAEYRAAELGAGG